MAQLTYTQNQAAAFAGMKGDSRDDTVDSHAAEGAIGFGLAVIAGTDPAVQVKLPAAAGGVFRGVSLQTHVAQTSAGVAAYADHDAVSVLRKGRVWVPVVTAVAVDGHPYFVNTGDDAGKFSATDDGTTDSARAGGGTAKYVTSTSGAGLALLELDLEGV